MCVVVVAAERVALLDNVRCELTVCHEGWARRETNICRCRVPTARRVLQMGKISFSLGEKKRFFRGSNEDQILSLQNNVCLKESSEVQSSIKDKYRIFKKNDEDQASL